MDRLTLAAGTTGFLAVAFGAFGAHALGDQLGTQAQGWWETATLYGLVHAVAALGVACSGRAPALAGWMFIAGAAVFAGTLYAMALGAPRAFGAVTPIGGLLLLGGWARFAFSAFRD